MDPMEKKTWEAHKIKLMRQHFSIEKGYHYAHGQTWDPKHEMAVSLIAGLSWDQIGTRAGDAILKSTLIALADARLRDERSLPKPMHDKVWKGLERLPEAIGKEAALKVWREVASWCCDASKNMFEGGVRRSDVESLTPALLALARWGGPELRDFIGRQAASQEALAKTKDERWDRAIAELMRGLLDQGMTLEGYWRIEPKAGLSVAEQIKMRIARLYPGAIKDTLSAAFEARDLGKVLENGIDAWDLKALPKELSMEALTLVERLERASPGEGARLAIEWLRSHPLLKEEPKSEPVKAPLKTKAARL